MAIRLTLLFLAVLVAYAGSFGPATELALRGVIAPRKVVGIYRWLPAPVKRQSLEMWGWIDLTFRRDADAGGSLVAQRAAD